MPLAFVRVTVENQIFPTLRDEWNAEMSRDGEGPPQDYYRTMMEHAAGIIERRDNDPKYGIFALIQRDDGGIVVGHDGFVHISHKLPNTSDATLRVLWNLLAPRHQQEIDRAKLARITTAFVVGAFELSQTHMPARQIKIFLGNSIDREYATIAAAFLEQNDASISFAVVGSWLHIAPR
jgi:hypothetical protein